MEVDEKPTEDYNDIGGLEKQASFNFVHILWKWLLLVWFFILSTKTCLLLQQIQELVEAIVLPMTHKERFQKLGIRPPKGVLLYGPPGTGKTLMARACAAQTNATFLKLAGPQLVQVGYSSFLFVIWCLLGILDLFSILKILRFYSFPEFYFLPVLKYKVLWMHLYLSKKYYGCIFVDTSQSDY